MGIGCDAIDLATQSHKPTQAVSATSWLDATHSSTTTNQTDSVWETHLRQAVFDALYESTTAFLESSRNRVFAANQLIRDCLADLEQTATRLRERHDKHTKLARNVREEILRPMNERPKVVDEVVPPLLQMYARKRLGILALETARTVLASIIRQVKDLFVKLNESTDHLQRLQIRRRDAVAERNSQDSLDLIHSTRFVSDRESLLEELDQAWTRQSANAEPLSVLLLQESSRAMHRLESQLLSAAQDIVRVWRRQIDTGLLLAQALDRDPSVRNLLKDRLKSVSPKLQEHGGQKYVVGISGHADSQPVVAYCAQEYLQADASVVTDLGGMSRS